MRLLHQLQVHQVELEMQNAQLEESRHCMEQLRDKYAELYDFAPVGYFTLDDRARILEVNLTGALLLGVERARLLHTSLARFIAPAGQAAFREFLGRVRSSPGQQACELSLRREGGSRFSASLIGTRPPGVDADHSGCQIAVSDISAVVDAREARQRATALDISNRELRAEIAHRQEIEDALKDSQSHQKQLLQQACIMQEQLRRVSHQLLSVQEEERKRISRELHDVVSQDLVGITVQLETLVQAASIGPDALRARIARTQRLVEQSVHSVRQFARELRPPLLDDLGLVPALHALLKDCAWRTGIRARFRTFAGVERLSNALRTVIYRVAQSALVNVVQHARATQVRLSIRPLPEAVLMEIWNDGRTFDVERVMRSGRRRHLGLISMRERVEMNGGTFTVLSEPGKGTTVRLTLPNPT